MSLKREMLVEAGIEDKAVIDNIMQAYGAGIENAKSQAKSELQAENDALKQQLEQQTQAINELQAKEGASAESKQQLEELKAQFDQYKLDSEANLAQITKTNAVALALKDVGAYNSEDLMKFIDLDKIELGEDGKPQLEDTINSLKESSPYLFQAEDKQPNPNISVHGNPPAETGYDHLSAEDKALFAGFDSV
ncbi:phage scaffolding protein [Streptococcus oralis]|uniref:phage scaffolding protein n=1 Tax=Streptococcus oralis TaxID=1303 RepID=UPI00021D2204|nr:phage scaffolding protein [Streptococcus oralis]EGV02778.1 phage minor structural protein GP20 [Streptococcus infantis SK970]ORO68838.1 scaffolding protein [Streptococcus oralis subsp. oralis]QBX25672.1 capsid and scaffold protein [Streptococcus phage Javan268]